MIEGIPVVGLSAPALLAIVFLMVMRGWLVPGRVLDAMERDRDHWRAATEKRDDQLSKLLVTAEASTAALTALTKVREDR